MFFGTARTSKRARPSVRTNVTLPETINHSLRSGSWTRKSFLHSLGFVMCAGTNGYCVDTENVENIRRSPRLDFAYHESLKVGAPPLGQAVTNLPIVINAVRSVELHGASGWGETVVEACFEPFDLVLARLEVVSRSATTRAVSYRASKHMRTP